MVNITISENALAVAEGPDSCNVVRSQNPLQTGRDEVPVIVRSF
jgi:hypothetical protein